jgi:cytochrome b561
MPRNPVSAAYRTSYSWAQIVLHWTIAALVIWQLFFSGRPPRFLYGSASQDLWTRTFESSHVWIGLLVLALVLVRVVLRLVHGAPPADESNPMVAMAAKGAHLFFYVLLFFMPITGILSWYFAWPTGGLHEAGQPVFVALIAVHVAAAVWHQFANRDGLMKRMLAPAH